MIILDPEWLETAADKKWLVAVSGGRDSIALLHACATDPNLTESNRLVICHVNHQLRGEDSEADEMMVRNLAAHYRLPISVHTAEVREIAEKEKISIELAAREARHKAFSKACEEHQCYAVLLAHHADDQVETALYNLLRGSSGLRGMQKTTFLTDNNLTLVRPILHIRRAEIDRYIAEYVLSFREDLTNAEPFAVRNRLRNEGIPLLNEILGRDIAPSILKSLQLTLENEAFIEEMIDYPSMLDPQGRIHLPSLKEVPQVIQQRILHRYLTEHKISNITHELIESCLNLLDPMNAAKVNLPRGKFLRRKENRIFVS